MQKKNSIKMNSKIDNKLKLFTYTFIFNRN